MNGFREPIGQIAAAVLLASAALSFAGPAAACSCFPENRAAQYARATDVFVAKAGKGPAPFPGSHYTGQEGVAAGGPTSRQVIYALDVDEVLKGSATKGSATVATSSSEAACGVVFEAGKTYLVFAKREDAEATAPEGAKDLLQTDLCMGSVSGDQLDAAIAEVRRLSERTVTPSQ